MYVADVRRLEDFGTQGIRSPAERFAEYQRQAKEIDYRYRGEFWMKVLDADPEVRAAVSFRVAGRRR